MTANDWTKVPNFILDNMANMKPSVFKVCMVVVRQTCGYIDEQGNRKEWDKLSTSRFEKLAGLSNRAVIDAIETAIDDGWIERRQAGQYFEYRIAPMKKVHSFSNEDEKTYENSSQVDEKTYENSSQVSYEKSSQVEPTYENSSQEPMNFFHTQKKYFKEKNYSSSQKPETDKNEDGAIAPENQAWFSALCWLVHEHQDYALLSKKERLLIGKTTKAILSSEGKYTLDDLRRWYKEKWSTEWPGKQKGASKIQPPTLEQIKTGIGWTRQASKQNEFAQAVPAVAVKPEPTYKRMKALN